MATTNLPNEYTYSRFCGLRNTSEYIKREIEDPKEYLTLLWSTLATVCETFEVATDPWEEKKIKLDSVWSPRAVATLMLHLRYLCEQVICGGGGSMKVEYAQNLKSIIEDILSHVSSGRPGEHASRGNLSCWGLQTLGGFKDRREKINELGVRASTLLLDHEKEDRDLLGETIQHAALWLIGSIIGMYNAIETDEKIGDVGDPNSNHGYGPGYTNECYESKSFTTITMLSSAPTANLEAFLIILRSGMQRRGIDSKHQAIFSVTKMVLKHIREIQYEIQRSARLGAGALDASVETRS